MTNGGINVEIGNPSYNMYEVDHDNHADAGSLLRPNFTLDPHKVGLIKYFFIIFLIRVFRTYNGPICVFLSKDSIFLNVFGCYYIITTHFNELHWYFI